jgi:hypothetical protein
MNHETGQSRAHSLPLNAARQIDRLCDPFEAAWFLMSPSTFVNCDFT